MYVLNKKVVKNTRNKDNGKLHGSLEIVFFKLKEIIAQIHMQHAQPIPADEHCEG